MKKVVILTVVVLLAGCSYICGISPKQRAGASETLQMLQAGYTTMVTILKENPNPKVYLAVALTDAGLNMAGTLLDKWCPTSEELALLEATAEAAKDAKAIAGI